MVDAAGNVWEWTTAEAAGGARIVRGGGGASDGRHLRGTGGGGGPGPLNIPPPTRTGTEYQCAFCLEKKQKPPHA